MSFHSWLQNLRSTLPPGRGKRQHRQRGSHRAVRYRPNLEVLEDRTVPSTFTVRNLADRGEGSLRQAILDANARPGADTIDFADGLSGTIGLTSGQLSIADGLTIHGPGAASLTINAIRLSRIFSIDDGISGPTIAVEISGLTLSEGQAPAFELGGAIANRENLTVTDTWITDNHAIEGGGGIFNGGGTLTVTDSTLSDDTADDGGGIFSAGSFDGSFPGLVTVTGCTLSFNFAQRGGGIFNTRFSTVTVNCSNLSLNHSESGGGIYNNHGTLAVTSSTLSQNIVELDGGGIFNAGAFGGLLTGLVSVSNSTLSGNFAERGGGIFNGGLASDFDFLGTVTITGSTLSGNSAGQGGGIFNNFTGTVTITGSTLSDNTAHSGGSINNNSVNTVTLNNTIAATRLSGGHISGVAFTGSHNLIEGQSPAGLSGTITADPMLGPLQDNGGPTLTCALLPGSPGIDGGGDDLVPAGVTNDQRGPGFARIVGGVVDIGAFEDQTVQPITLCGNSVVEHQPVGTVVGSFQTNEPTAAGPFIYALVAGAGSTDNASFTIDQAGNLVTAAPFDLDTQSSYSIRVQSTDASGLTVERAFTIYITNLNEAPTDVALSNSSVAENLTPGTRVGIFSTTDPDAGDIFTCALVSGDGDTDNALFLNAFNHDDGAILRTAASFDFEARSTYSIRVRSTDAGGLSVERAFTINITDVNETPVVIDPVHLLNAFEDVATTVANVSVSDPDGDNLTVILGVGFGTLTLGSTTGLFVTGNGSGSVSLSGNVDALNAALASLSYLPTLNYAGLDTLSISASDSSFSSSASVATTVKSAAQQANDLQALVGDLRADGELNNGQANSLTAKLRLQGDSGDIGKVKAFLNEVDALLKAGILGQADADKLLVAGKLLLLSVTRR
jgi:hypothetical protein